MNADNDFGGGGDEPPEDDLDVWQAATKGIVPLPGKKTLLARPLPGRWRGRRPSEERMTSAASLPITGEQEQAGAAGLDGRTDARLRRGELPIEGRLDLHGMTQDRALPALEEFIGRCYAEGRRCVLVITGTGMRNAGRHDESDWTTPRPGVLRDRVPEWLRSGRIGALVLRFYPAQRRHGGDGAFYVLLRRIR